MFKKSFILAVCFSTAVSYASVLTLGKVLVGNPSSMKSYFRGAPNAASNNFSGAEGLVEALKSLNSGKSVDGAQNLSLILSSLETQAKLPKQREALKNLRSKLDQEISTLSGGELEKIYIDLLFLGEQFGKLSLDCSVCSADAAGYAYSVAKSFAHPEVASIWSKMPKSSKVVRKQSDRYLRDITPYSRWSSKVNVAEEDEKALHLFGKLCTGKSLKKAKPGLKSLCLEIKNASQNEKGVVNVLNIDGNGHKLFRYFYDNKEINDEFMGMIAGLFKKAGSNSERYNGDLRKAVYAELDLMAKNHEDGIEAGRKAVETIKKNGCLFKR